MVVGLNPSRANATHDDPTVRKEWSWAKKSGYKGYVKLNLFDVISPYPKDLLESKKPCSNLNRLFLKTFAKNNQLVLAFGRVDSRILHHAFIPQKNTYCFSVNKDGSPRHPLYMKNSEMKLYRYDA